LPSAAQAQGSSEDLEETVEPALSNGPESPTKRGRREAPAALDEAGFRLAARDYLRNFDRNWRPNWKHIRDRHKDENASLFDGTEEDGEQKPGQFTISDEEIKSLARTVLREFEAGTQGIRVRLGTAYESDVGTGWKQEVALEKSLNRPIGNDPRTDGCSECRGIRVILRAEGVAKLVVDDVNIVSCHPRKDGGTSYFSGTPGGRPMDTYRLSPKLKVSQRERRRAATRKPSARRPSSRGSRSHSGERP
jgi:hypothetical protein